MLPMRPPSLHQVHGMDQQRAETLALPSTREVEVQASSGLVGGFPPPVLGLAVRPRRGSRR